MLKMLEALPGVAWAGLALLAGISFFAVQWMLRDYAGEYFDW